MSSKVGHYRVRAEECCLNAVKVEDNSRRNISKDAVLLRIFCGEDDTFDQSPLYETIVNEARRMQLSGATVLRGPMGYGHRSRLHAAQALGHSIDRALVVEIVDTEAKIKGFLPVLDQLVSSGLITLEKVQVLKYGSEF